MISKMPSLEQMLNFITARYGVPNTNEILNAVGPLSDAIQMPTSQQQVQQSIDRIKSRFPTFFSIYNTPDNAQQLLKLMCMTNAISHTVAQYPHLYEHLIGQLPEVYDYQILEDKVIQQIRNFDSRILLYKS